MVRPKLNSSKCHVEQIHTRAVFTQHPAQRHKQRREGLADGVGAGQGAQTLNDSFCVFLKLTHDFRGQNGVPFRGEQDHGERWGDGFRERSLPCLVVREGMSSLGFLR